MIAQLAWIAAGGALGAVARYLLTAATFGALGYWATLVVNVVGSFTIGVIFAALSDVPWFHNIARPFLIIGVLGSFTTFSTFSIETVTLLDDGRAALALIYATTSVLGCVAAAWAGSRVAI